ncbi:MAG: DUF1513 domain-containing protein [Cohaesibacteraceae bacterium]|nr:DUF1513 domain-containing protein [Cohaesibacteraceae bacterium]
MEISRRTLLASATVSLFMTGKCPTARAGTVQFASCRREVNGSFSAVLLDEAGQDLEVFPLQGRGHDVAFSPDGRILVAPARRPGNFCLVASTSNSFAPRIITAPIGRHFYGHGVFSKNGHFYFTTENDFENAIGIIGIYDVNRGFMRIGEYRSYGVGPHDIAILPDGKTIVVANGGIETHPDYGRAKLNLPLMKPSLAYIDVENGNQVDLAILHDNLHKLSIRHLTVIANGTVWFGCQFQGSKLESPALIGHHRMGEPIAMTHLPDELAGQLKNYIGSITGNSAGDIVAASAPRGNLVLFWNTVTGAYLGNKSMKDGCGIAATSDNGFLLSSGSGKIAATAISPGSLTTLSSRPDISWDNHMTNHG